MSKEQVGNVKGIEMIDDAILAAICIVIAILVVASLLGYIRFREMQRLYKSAEVDTMLEAQAISNQCKVCNDSRHDFGVVMSQAWRVTFAPLETGKQVQIIARRCVRCGHIEMFAKGQFDQFIHGGKR